MEQKLELVKDLIDDGKLFIICGFPGVGKTTASNDNFDVIDFESSPFSHTDDGEINVDFPNNYIDALINAIVNKVKLYGVRCSYVYLLSTHEKVRNELRNRGINYIMVLPSIHSRNEYSRRYLKRKSSMKFIQMMDDTWHDKMKSCIDDPMVKIYLKDDEYLSCLF